MLTNTRALLLLSALAPLLAQCSATLPEGASVATGAWGGDHIALTVANTGAQVEFDCASGTIDEPLALDDSGRFEARGSYTAQSFGPVREDQPEQARSARYSGHLRESTLTLTVALAESNETVGVYTLTRGKARLTRCM